MSPPRSGFLPVRPLFPLLSLVVVWAGILSSSPAKRAGGDGLDSTATGRGGLALDPQEPLCNGGEFGYLLVGFVLDVIPVQHGGDLIGGGHAAGDPGANVYAQQAPRFILLFTPPAHRGMYLHQSFKIGYRGMVHCSSRGKS